MLTKFDMIKLAINKKRYDLDTIVKVVNQYHSHSRINDTEKSELLELINVVYEVVEIEVPVE